MCLFLLSNQFVTYKKNSAYGSRNFVCVLVLLFKKKHNILKPNVLGTVAYCNIVSTKPSKITTKKPN